MKENEKKELLQKSLENIKPLKPEATFRPIANNLMNNYCIKCGGKEYYFAEIEFYYYREEDKKMFEEKKEKNWEDVTYPRKSNAGDLFYHLSGIDICFESDLEKQDKGGKLGYGGGILIRAIVNANDSQKLIVGPLTCKDEILNACEGEKMPSLEPASKKRNIKPSETYRYLGKTDFDSIDEKGNKDGNHKLAFYDAITLSPSLWNKARSSYYDSRLTRKTNNGKQC